MTKTQSSNSILWAQVWGLAAIQGAITLMWVIYNLYLVALLTDLGFPQPLATGLLVLENILAMGMEPLMGSFSDRLQHQVGTRFPIISLGVILAAGIFLAIPIGGFWGQGPLLRWLVPGLMVAWALAMTVFRSPAMSLLGRYAFNTHLPQAASILTLVGAIAGAAGPLANSFILGLGPIVAFSLGSGVLLLATLALSRLNPNHTIQPKKTASAATSPLRRPLNLAHLGLIFGTGTGVALGFRLIMTTFPGVLKENVTAVAPPLIMAVVFLAIAMTAIPAGQWATRFGNRRAMIGGLGLLVFLTVVINAVSNVVTGVIVAILLGGALSLVFNGTLPFALSLVPADKAGLGTGLYFSGGGLATCLFASLLKGDSLPPSLKMVVAALAFLLAGLCITATASTRAER
jgi:MFS family permease